MPDFRAQSGDRVLFIGDSITDCGRRNEASAPFGAGYVRMAVNMITAKYPERDINRMLVPYFDAVHRLAEKFNAVLVPVHQAFQEALKVRHDELWSQDNVHPIPEGHAFIALQWLNAMVW